MLIATPAPVLGTRPEHHQWLAQYKPLMDFMDRLGYHGPPPAPHGTHKEKFEQTKIELHWLARWPYSSWGRREIHRLWWNPEHKIWFYGHIVHESHNFIRVQMAYPLACPVHWTSQLPSCTLRPPEYTAQRRSLDKKMKVEYDLPDPIATVSLVPCTICAGPILLETSDWVPMVNLHYLRRSHRLFCLSHTFMSWIGYIRRFLQSKKVKSDMIITNSICMRGWLGEMGPCDSRNWFSILVHQIDIWGCCLSMPFGSWIVVCTIPSSMNLRYLQTQR